jgi:hypothetical protein
MGTPNTTPVSCRVVHRSRLQDPAATGWCERSESSLLTEDRLMVDLSWYQKMGTAETLAGKKAHANDPGAEPEYLYRDDLAYGQLADELANGMLEDDEELDLPPLDGWLADV